MKISWMQRFNWENSSQGLFEMAQTLDKAGVYSVLLPYGSTSPDYFAWLPDLVNSTQNLKFMMALRPYSITPEYAYRVFRTGGDVFRNRITLNVVAGSLSPEEEQYTFKYYNGDLSKIDTIDKRIAMSDEWTNIFLQIYKDNPGPQRPEMYTIANSPSTMELANKYFDCAIHSQGRLEYNVENRRDGMRLVLIIDPLILNDDGSSDVKYLWQPTQLEKDGGGSTPRKQHHAISGTHEEVKAKLIEISDTYGIDEFLVHTDQADISKILKLVKELS